MDPNNPENWLTITGIILNVIGIIEKLYRLEKNKK